MVEMSYEELQAMNKINDELAMQGLKSRLSYLHISGIREGYVTEWGFEKNIKEEAAKANVLVSELVREL